MMSDQLPKMIALPKVDSKGGFISFAEDNKHIPFEIKRTYWCYGNENEVTRGNHFHPNSERMIIAMCGSIAVELENQAGAKNIYTLSCPYQALHIPANHWMKIKMSSNSIMLALASCYFDEDEAISSYDTFQSINNG